MVKYSDDYPHLESNWNSVIEKYNIKKGKIMIVDEIISDENHTLINLFCNIYTQVGFIVRSKNELIPCKVCDKAIPSEESYNKMKKLNIIVPDEWQVICKNCV